MHPVNLSVADITHPHRLVTVRAAALLARFSLTIVLVLLSLVPARADRAESNTVLYVFWAETCPVCIRQKPWIEQLDTRFPGLQVVEMELSRSDQFHALFEDMATARGTSAAYVPTLILGPRVWVGDTPAQELCGILCDAT